MAFQKAAAVMLGLAVSAFAELKDAGLEDVAVEVDSEASAMRMQLLQASLKNKVQFQEEVDEEDVEAISDEVPAQLHVTEGTFAALLESDAEESGASDLETSGKCDNSKDKAIWAKNGNKEFSNDINVCSNKCWGGDWCVRKCMRERKGYTRNCSKCFGELSSCTAGACMIPCLGGGAPCDKCVQDKCRPAWIKCMGNMR